MSIVKIELLELNFIIDLTKEKISIHFWAFWLNYFPSMFEFVNYYRFLLTHKDICWDMGEGERGGVVSLICSYERVFDHLFQIVYIMFVYTQLPRLHASINGPVFLIFIDSKFKSSWRKYWVVCDLVQIWNES